MCNSAGTIPRLSISADVKQSMDSLDLFTMTPFSVDLDQKRPEEQKSPWEYEISLKNISDKDLTFKVISKPDGYFDLEFPEDKVIKPGDDKTVSVKFQKGIADDIFAKSFTIEASDSAHTRMTIPFVKAMRWGPAPTSAR